MKRTQTRRRHVNTARPSPNEFGEFSLRIELVFVVSPGLSLFQFLEFIRGQACGQLPFAFCTSHWIPILDPRVVVP